MRYSLPLLALAVQRAIAQTDYGFWWQPGAVVTTLNATMKMPSVPAGPGIHYIWPGLQPNSDNFVFQDVAGDELGTGAWTFAEWSVDSNGNYNKSSDVKVYPGDSIAISFTLNTATGAWNDIWTTTPGSAGSAAGEKVTIGDVIAPKNEFAAYGNLTQVLFIVEIYDGTWDFGNLNFTDITMVAETTDTTWCNKWTQQNSFTYAMSTPVGKKVGTSSSSCSVATLSLLNPS